MTQKNTSNNLIKAIFYGSLRSGQYNCERFQQSFGKENFVYQNTKTITGYQLYSLGSYPMVLKDPNSNLVVDEFLISPEAAESVRRMELGAGYSEEEIDGATIYYYDDNRYNAPKVESGDWSEYLKEKDYV